MLTVRHRSPEVAYVANPLMDRYLINLGLYQLATMKQPRRIDQALMCGLVERWRSETHSFHLPVGEMTVTLQDVSALWGLRIDGDPVGGVSDHQFGSGTMGIAIYGLVPAVVHELGVLTGRLR